MSNHTYKAVELTGTSDKGVDDAMRNVIAKASQTLRGLDWFEVLEIRGRIEDNEISHVQVTMKIGFRVE